MGKTQSSQRKRSLRVFAACVVRRGAVRISRRDPPQPPPCSRGVSGDSEEGIQKNVLSSKNPGRAPARRRRRTTQRWPVTWTGLLAQRARESSSTKAILAHWRKLEGKGR